MRSEPRPHRSFTSDDITCESWRNELRVIFPSAPLAVRNALQSTLDGLAHLRLSEDDRSNLELVLAEVLNNIVEHGYGDESSGMIELHVAHDPVGLTCVTLDCGNPLPNGALPRTDPPDPTLPLAALAEGGFGWYLINELSSDLRYERVGSRNRLDFRLKLGQRVQSC